MFSFFHLITNFRRGSLCPSYHQGLLMNLLLLLLNFLFLLTTIMNPLKKTSLLKNSIDIERYSSLMGFYVLSIFQSVSFVVLYSAHVVLCETSEDPFKLVLSPSDEALLLLLLFCFLLAL